MAEIVLRAAGSAAILMHGPPLPLAEVRAQLLPRHLFLLDLFKANVFGGHGKSPPQFGKRSANEVRVWKEGQVPQIISVRLVADQE